MAKQQTIVVEDRLKEIFDYLPDMVGADTNSYTPVFKAGDEHELLAFFNQSQGNTNYPLIWLELPFKEDHKNHNRQKLEVLNLSLILAVETNSSMVYSERLETTFKTILYPLLDNILDVMRVSNTLSYDGNFSITKFANYSDAQIGIDGEFADIWDAIKLEVDVIINDDCLREIKL